MVLQTPIKQKSYKGQIVELEVTQKAYAPYESRATIAPIISGIKREYKGRDFRTSKFTLAGCDLLEIERLS